MIAHFVQNVKKKIGLYESSWQKQGRIFNDFVFFPKCWDYTKLKHDFLHDELKSLSLVGEPKQKAYVQDPCFRIKRNNSLWHFNHINLNTKGVCNQGFKMITANDNRTNHRCSVLKVYILFSPSVFLLIVRLLGLSNQSDSSIALA